MKEQYQKDTILYYDENCQQYYEEKNEIMGFEDVYQPFLQSLKKGSRILDFGCGTGRDAKYFKEKGYLVDALDGSKEMCNIAEQNTGMSIIQKNFLQFKASNTYDGIWACASLLHLNINDLTKVLKNLAQALKEDGYLYMSFKVGNFEGIRHGRYFNDMTEEKINNLMQNVNELAIEKVYYNQSVLCNQQNKNWINLILRKKKSIKVLSIKEPFATLIKEKIKRIETRSWKTNYRGELYIHASISKSTLEHKDGAFLELIQDLSYQQGFIICKCQLVDCVYMTKDYIEDMKKNHYREYLCGLYEEGRYAWVLDEIEPLSSPLPAKGRLGIWNYFEEDSNVVDDILK